MNFFKVGYSPLAEPYFNTIGVRQKFVLMMQILPTLVLQLLLIRNLNILIRYITLGLKLRFSSLILNMKNFRKKFLVRLTMLLMEIQAQFLKDSMTVGLKKQ